MSYRFCENTQKPTLIAFSTNNSAWTETVVRENSQISLAYSKFLYIEISTQACEMNVLHSFMNLKFISFLLFLLFLKKLNFYRCPNAVVTIKSSRVNKSTSKNRLCKTRCAANHISSFFKDYRISEWIPLYTRGYHASFIWTIDNLLY